MNIQTICRWLPVVGCICFIFATGCSAHNPVKPGGSAESRFVRAEPNKTKVIIFVHGVTGNATSTWTNEQTNAYWPSLIASDKNFADANVYVFEYPSPPIGRSLSVNELADSMRSRLQSDKVLSYPELIFLSHSMGGLVTRTFLLKYREQAAKVKFAYFFATPTEGSPSAVLASLAGNPQFKNMYPLQADNDLANLHRDWLAARLGIRSFCAYEVKPTFGVLIVNYRSASNLCTEPLDPINEDHIQIVKPIDTKADAYIAFKNAFDTMSGTQLALSASPMIPPKDARFGVTLGWQLERYNQLYVPSNMPFLFIEDPLEDIKALLQQDGYPRSLEGQKEELHYQKEKIIRSVLLYYGTSNLYKHASILVGIAAYRVSHVETYKEDLTENLRAIRENEKSAFRAISEIDDSVILRKQEFFNELLTRRPQNIADTLSFLATAKLR